MKKVTCADCGFLALREMDSGQLIEADIMYRTEGWQCFKKENLSIIPYCSIRAQAIHREIFHGSDGSVIEFPCETPLLKSWHNGDVDVGASAILINISQQRSCDKWMPWREGFSPKEHREMLSMEDMHRRQVRQNWLNILVAGLALAVAVAAIWFGCWTTEKQIKAQEKLTNMQIEASKNNPNPVNQ